MLGQEQQFTLILQTLQQLRDVYGESVDKIVQGNVANIIFLKSTDDAMIDQLQKMSGTTHKVFRDTKTITRNEGRLFMKNEANISIQMNVREMPVISYNDMAFISERNSMVFSAGQSPIWNRNDTILPMSWKLFENTITQPGKTFSLQTIPTLSSALDFDVRKNQPNFIKMWEKRRDQSSLADMAKAAYQEAYGYSDYDIKQLDPDNYADEIMEIINRQLALQNGENPEAAEASEDEDADGFEMSPEDDEYDDDEYEDNTEVAEAVAAKMDERGDWGKGRYAGGMISRESLGRKDMHSHALDKEIIEAFREVRAYMFRDRDHFSDDNGSLMSADGRSYYIQKLTDSEAKEALRKAQESPGSSVYDQDGRGVPDTNGYVVCDEFLDFLVAQETWKDFASGKFEEEMIKIMTAM